MQFPELFDVFSRRHRQLQKPVAPLTPKFRNRVLMRCMEVFSDPYTTRTRERFLSEIYQRMRYLVGRDQLTAGRHLPGSYNDVARFVETCTDEEFLDFIVCIFQTPQYRAFWQDENFLVNDINFFFREDDLPYAVTPFVRETRKTKLHGGQEQTEEVIVAYPRVICRDDEATYVLAIEPALTLLRDKQFTSANKEFLEALEDHRNGDYGDCLTKCGSALETQ